MVVADFASIRRTSCHRFKHVPYSWFHLFFFRSARFLSALLISNYENIVIHSKRRIVMADAFYFIFFLHSARLYSAAVAVIVVVDYYGSIKTQCRDTRSPFTFLCIRLIAV